MNRLVLTGRDAKHCYTRQFDSSLDDLGVILGHRVTGKLELVQSLRCKVA